MMLMNNKQYFTLFLLLSFFWGVSNHAVAKFNLSTSQTLNYAVESITSNDYNNKGQLVISSNSDTLNLEVEVGFGLSSDFRYARLDIINGTFNSAFPSSGVEISANYKSTLVAGGGVGDSFVIIELSATPSVGADTELLFDTTSFNWDDIGTPLEIQYTLYDTADAAVNHLGYLYRKNAVLSQFIRAAGNKFIQSFQHYSGFDNNFLRFSATFRSPSTFKLGDASETLASVGKIRFDQLVAVNTLLPSTSNAISDYRKIIPGVKTDLKSVSISGDFSSITASLNEDDDCSGAAIELLSFSNENSVLTSIDELIDHPVFCIEASSNTQVIEPSEYYLDFGGSLGKGLLGAISYDAATADLPFITTFSDYKQKIYIVNYAGYPVAYSTQFIAESGKVISLNLKDAANGIIPAKTTLKLNTTDLVEIEGEVKRASARFFFDTKAKNLAVSSQLLSVSNSGVPPTEHIVVKDN
ncbi:hypothetical protein [Neptunicella marina]|uniref:Uncharacterized protein n=1 Tax=Neptunicella marina TaxID=2125989 RepID=A0A8J6M0K9_9ALTE|nr:hypothetical protein [Neptunicella marina]MBC3764933.1 hypothetical protein [Neptunicella marina]